VRSELRENSAWREQCSALFRKSFGSLVLPYRVSSAPSPTHPHWKSPGPVSGRTLFSRQKTRPHSLEDHTASKTTQPRRPHSLEDHTASTRQPRRIPERYSHFYDCCRILRSPTRSTVSISLQVTSNCFLKTTNSQPVVPAQVLHLGHAPNFEQVSALHRGIFPCAVSLCGFAISSP